MVGWIGINQINQPPEQLCNYIRTSNSNCFKLTHDSSLPSNTDEDRALAEKDRFVLAAEQIAKNPAILAVQFSNLKNSSQHTLQALSFVLDQLSNKKIIILDLNENDSSSLLINALKNSKISCMAIGVRKEIVGRLGPTLATMKNLKTLHLVMYGLNKKNADILANSLIRSQTLERMDYKNRCSVRTETLRQFLNKLQPTLQKNQIRSRNIAMFESHFPSSMQNRYDDNKGRRFYETFINTIGNVTTNHKEQLPSVLTPHLTELLTTEDAIKIAQTSKETLSVVHSFINNREQTNALKQLYASEIEKLKPD